VSLAKIPSAAFLSLIVSGAQASQRAPNLLTWRGWEFHSGSRMPSPAGIRLMTDINRAGWGDGARSIEA